MRSLVWFRSDLRTVDNTALYRACKLSGGDSKGAGVIGLFVVSPAEWKAHAYAPAKVDLILRTLRELSRSLAAINIPLLVRIARSARDVPQTVLNVARTNSCDALWFNKEYEVNETARDAAVTRACTREGLKAFACTDQSLIEPGEIRTGEGRPYTVFTPFKKACVKHLSQDATVPLPAPRQLAAMPVLPDEVPTSVPGWLSTVPADRWPAGEATAHSRLDSFVNTLAAAYKQNRDFPSLAATSELSPHLTVGSISPRQCVAAALAANNGSFDAGNDGLVCWISEVLWREFYIYVMHSFPKVCKHRAFVAWTESVRWLNNDAHFEAWKEGRTGVPIVDAGMRQLVAEGWMHNRVRMITAMYLSKNLLIDWRLGEDWFMRNLVDGFLASNNGGWQWSASTGTDAAPYFRIFNPITQSERFDSDGAYIRRYVPELAALGGDVIHDPSRLPPIARAKVDYPDMLVDLSTSRQRAIDAFAAAKP
ncbi:MAG TPA: deoxyribodipyrimidine photo-lyase [Phycisphaerales bacterium]|nr:deoxyribodipyrimidine photo-lyase [Phycisphaerales bacterium]